jgi:hypothetical protein
MPTVENLDRLQGILARLRPLAEIRGGELIRADDWNTIVAAVLDLANAVLSGGGDEGVPTHSHDDQVQLSWLDARLRSLLQEGPLGDPRNVARVADLERRLDRADGDLGTVRDTVGSLRDRVGDVTTRDVAREADLTSVRLSIDSVTDSRRDVLALRASLDAIRTDVQRAVELGGGLTVGGKPVRMDDVVKRLRAVEEVRERLTREDGELLDAAFVERRLAEHGAAYVSTDQLDATLKKMRPRVSEEQVASIRTDVLAAASAQVDSSLGSLRADVDGRLDKRLADVDSRIATVVTSATPGIRDEVLASAKQVFAEGIERSGAETRALVERRLAESSGEFSSRIDSHVAGVREELLSSVRDSVDRLSREHLDPLAERLSVLANDVATTSGGLGDLRGHLGALGEGLAGLDQRVGVVVDEALARAKDQTVQIVRTEIAGVHERMEGLLAESFAVRVDAAMSVATDRMREIAREEDKTVRADTRTMVTTQVERAISTVPDRLARDIATGGVHAEAVGRIVDARLRDR